MRRTAMVLALALATACSNPAEPPADPDAVLGTAFVGWRQDDGTTILRPAWPPGTTVSALIQEGAGWREVPGVVRDDGTFTVSAVSRAGYLLAVRRPDGLLWLSEQASHVVDLGYDRVGHPDAPVTQLPTSVDGEVSGLEPWVGAGDSLLLYSTAAGADQPLCFGIAEGATAARCSFALAGSHLPAASSRAWLVQKAARASAGGLRYRVAVRQAGVEVPAGLVEGAALTLAPPALSAAPSSGSIGLDLRFSEYLPLLPAAAGLTTMPRTAQVAVMASPWTPGTTQGLALMDTDNLGFLDADLGTITYPRFLPAWFVEERQAIAFVTVLLDEALGAPAQAFSFVIQKSEPADGAPAIVRPSIGPARNPAIAGRDATLVEEGVGLTPTLSWDPPSLGTATRYEVGIYDRSAGGTWSPLFLQTTGTSFALPPGLLRAGHVYFAVIAPVSEPNHDPAAPNRSTLPREHAVTLTAAFSP